MLRPIEKFFKLEEPFKLGPFNFVDIGFQAIIQKEDRAFNLPFMVQVEEVLFFSVNGAFICPFEVDDFFAVQPPKLKEDLFLILHDFILNTY